MSLQFIDLCILLGCDYCDSIRGIGPKKAVELINKHKCIEKIIENIDKRVQLSTTSDLDFYLKLCIILKSNI